MCKNNINAHLKKKYFEKNSQVQSKKAIIS